MRASAISENQNGWINAVNGENGNVPVKQEKRLLTISSAGRSSGRRQRAPYSVRAARARKKRACQVRRMYGLFGGAMALSLLAASLLVFGVTSHADESGKPLHKYYTSVLVTDSSTLRQMADQYAEPSHYRSAREYYREVCEINHLTAEDDGIPQIAPGNYVILPYYSADLITS